jgi:hypothetical protein
MIPGIPDPAEIAEVDGVGRNPETPTSIERLLRASYRPWATDGYRIRLKPLVSNNEPSVDGSTFGSKNRTPADGLLKEPSPRPKTLTTDHRLHYFRRLLLTTVSKTSTFRGAHDRRPPRKERRIILGTDSRNRDDLPFDCLKKFIWRRLIMQPV